MKNTILGLALVLGVLGSADVYASLQYDLFTGNYRLNPRSIPFDCGYSSDDHGVFFAVVTNNPEEKLVQLHLTSSEGQNYASTDFSAIDQGRDAPTTEECTIDGLFHPEGVSATETTGNGNSVTSVDESYTRGLTCPMRVAIHAYGGRVVNTLEVDGNQIKLTETIDNQSPKVCVWDRETP